MDDLKQTKQTEPQAEEDVSAQGQSRADTSGAVTPFVDKSYGRLRPFQLSDAFRDFVGNSGLGSTVRTGLLIFERWSRREQGQLANSLRVTEEQSDEISRLRGELEAERVRNAALEGKLAAAKERTTIFALTGVLGAAALSAGVALYVKGEKDFGVPLIIIAIVLLLLPFIVKLLPGKKP